MHNPAAKTLPFILFALAMLSMASCNGLGPSDFMPSAATLTSGTVLGGAAAAALIYETRPGPLPPADTEHQIAQHESWCYGTMGYAECYAHPQDVPPERLINVDPPNRYPLTTFNYNQALAGEKQTALQ
jgi:hypothetical protein